MKSLVANTQAWLQTKDSGGANTLAWLQTKDSGGYQKGKG